MVSGPAWLPGPRGGTQRWRPPSSPPSSSFCLRPDGLMYQKFRNQFLSFSMYQSECLGVPGRLSTRRQGGLGRGLWAPAQS